MIHIMVRHKVEDFAKWKAAFNVGSEMRAAASSKKGHIFRESNDPSMVTVLSHFDDAGQAQAFMQSPAMTEAVKASGVIGEPEIFLFGYEEKYVD